MSKQYIGRGLYQGAQRIGIITNITADNRFVIRLPNGLPYVMQNTNAYAGWVIEGFEHEALPDKGSVYFKNMKLIRG